MGDWVRTTTTPSWRVRTSRDHSPEVVSPSTITPRPGFGIRVVSGPCPRRRPTRRQAPGSFLRAIRVATSGPVGQSEVAAATAYDGGGGAAEVTAGTPAGRVNATARAVTNDAPAHPPIPGP